MYQTVHFKCVYFIACQSYLNKVALKIKQNQMANPVGKKGPKILNLGKTNLWKSGDSVCLGGGADRGEVGSRTMMLISWFGCWLQGCVYFGNSSGWTLMICAHLCICVMLQFFKKSCYKKQFYIHLCSWCRTLWHFAALFQGKVPATLILGDESSHCAFPGGRKISSEVSQKAVYYFHKWGMCRF